MSPSITRIDCAGPGRTARRLVFDDGRDPRITSAAAVRELGLEANAEIDPNRLSASLDEVEPSLAKERALCLLGYRDRSSAELSAKLRDSGYPEHVAASVVARLQELDLVDDARFALEWTRSRSSAGYGDRRVLRELAEKGVAGETAAEAVEAVFGSEDQLERARRALNGRTPASRADRERLVRRLVTKGFSLSVALEAVGEDRCATDDAL